jgi:hypothetical protein
MAGLPFTRNADGSWTCNEATTLAHPAGRIQIAECTCFRPGKTFMGIDVVRWLEELLPEAQGARRSQAVARW